MYCEEAQWSVDVGLGPPHCLQIRHRSQCSLLQTQLLLPLPCFCDKDVLKSLSHLFFLNSSQEPWSSLTTLHIEPWHLFPYNPSAHPKTNKRHPSRFLFFRTLLQPMWGAQEKKPFDKDFEQMKTFWSKLGSKCPFQAAVKFFVTFLWLEEIKFVFPYTSLQWHTGGATH